MVSPSVVVLGPQRLAPTVRSAVEELRVLDTDSAHYALVTAGWEEREGEDQELRDHLGGRCTNLNLHERAEDVYHRDPELLDAMQRRWDRLLYLQDLYRLRLAHALDAARELLARTPQGDDDDLLEVERRSAINTVRRLDDHHAKRVAELNQTFFEELRPTGRAEVARHRAEIEGILSGATALCVAGGHVTVLLNRMRIFGLDELLADRPLLCWSAGAMVLSERVVVFHDSPPQGQGNAEVIEVGLGVLPGLVPLPHASRRLRLDDPVRVGLFARRFGPSICAVLDERTRIQWDGDAWSAGGGTRRLREDGALEEIVS